MYCQFNTNILIFFKQTVNNILFIKVIKVKKIFFLVKCKLCSGLGKTKGF